MVPGKEVRGSRVDFDNQGTEKAHHPLYDCPHVVQWTARLHLGEGVAEKREVVLSVAKGFELLQPYLAQKSEVVNRLKALAQRLDVELPGIVPDATTLQAVYTLSLIHI